MHSDANDALETYLTDVVILTFGEAGQAGISGHQPETGRDKFKSWISISGSKFLDEFSRVNSNTSDFTSRSLMTFGKIPRLTLLEIEIQSPKQNTDRRDGSWS